MKACCKAFLEEQFAGMDEVVAEIYSEFVASAGEKLGEIVSAAERKDWEAVDQLAHAVKGNALAVGDQDLASEAVALRGAAKLGDAGRAAECIARLRELVDEL